MYSAHARWSSSSSPPGRHASNSSQLFNLRLAELRKSICRPGGGGGRRRCLSWSAQTIGKKPEPSDAKFKARKGPRLGRPKTNCLSRRHIKPTKPLGGRKSRQVTRRFCALVTMFGLATSQSLVKLKLDHKKSQPGGQAGGQAGRRPGRQVDSQTDTQTDLK